VRRALLLTGVLAIPLAGCGGGDETTAPATVTLPTASTTTETAQAPASTTTSTQSGEGGGDGEATPQPGSGSGAPNAMVAATAVLTADGTAEQACGRYVTETYIRASYGGEANCIAEREHADLAGSIAAAPGTDENAIRITVTPSGGPYDGAEVTVNLVVEDGGYRVDAIKAHVPAGP
jgi:hypothetical protein